VCCQVEFCVRQ